MANHASAKKRIRQTAKRNARNRHIRTTVRSVVKRVRAAIDAGDKTTAQESLGKAVSLIDRAVAKGIYHRRAGSRYISRLTQRVLALA
ncbi:MAG: 30S ribosomal protein S20 [Sandaracinaceae bacterium]|nr:30S ribosomal protein S20 [Sandaracinaceae bacterium]